MSHLAFAAILFPLLVKKRLSDARGLVLDERDCERLRRIDRYLINDPFQPDSFSSDAPHPWRQLDIDINMRMVGRRILQDLTPSQER